MAAERALRKGGIDLEFAPGDMRANGDGHREGGWRTTGDGCRIVGEGSERNVGRGRCISAAEGRWSSLSGPAGAFGPRRSDIVDLVGIIEGFALPALLALVTSVGGGGDGHRRGRNRRRDWCRR